MYTNKIRYKQRPSSRRATRRITLRLLAVLVLGLLLGLGWRVWHAQTTTTSSNVTEWHVLTAPKPLHSYGIAAGSSLTSLSSQALNARLDGIATTGAQWIRFDFDWSLIQPTDSHEYRWTTYDKIVAAATKRHLSILGIITYTPAWARDAACADDDKCPPADPAQFAAFAAALAHRYKQNGVHDWEIWNEPNNPQFWASGANPTAYTALLKQTFTALHAEDNQSYVLTGGLSPQPNSNTAVAPIDFLAGIYKAGGKDFFDAVADHPYTFPLSPLSAADHAWNQMAADNHSLRQLMVTNGDAAKKIWITEFGAPTDGPGPVATLQNPQLDAHPYVVNDQLQAKLLADAVSLYKSYSWVGPFFYYSYQDAGTDPSTNENFFGLLRYDGSQKPAYAAFKQAAAAAH
ncbi:MAG TPA: cellulase family glycosylhydrolase [Candidatus Saccharimonadales bacterium]|nr:cellulase family glycosylhydrolase [Candidatus Saccharimonadales bacterium]